MKKPLKSLSILALGLSLTVLGQDLKNEPIAALDEVVLFGLKTPQKEGLIGKNITLLTEEDLVSYRGYSLAQLLNTVSGLSIQGANLSMGNTQSIYARGGRAKQVLFLVDGIRVADPYSASLSYDLRLLDLSQIKQIEVLKGASSALYGTSAATVVIAITTKEINQDSLNLTSGLGTNQTTNKQQWSVDYRSYGMNYKGSIQKLNYQLNFSNLYQGGISALNQTSEEDPFTRSAYSFLLGNGSDHRFSWKLRLAYNSMTADYDDSFLAEDADFQFLTQKKGIGLTSNYQLSKGHLFFSLNHLRYTSEDRSNYSGVFESATSNFDVYYKGKVGENLSAIAGIQSSKDESKSINQSAVTFIDPYLSMFYINSKGFHLNSGLRLNHHQTYGNHFVGQINPSYSFGIDDQYVLYTSLASAYISPSLFQLYGDWGANDSLTPEENTTYELGIRGSYGHSFWNIVGFMRKETNAVFWNAINNQYDNAKGTSKAKGIEVDFRTMIKESIQLKFNYTFIERAQPLMIRIPKHKLNLSAVYAKEKHRFLFETQYVGERYDTDFSTYTDLKLSDYTLVHMNWNYSLNKAVTIQLGIRNLLNTDFVEQIGYSTLGRNFRLSLNYHLF